MIYYTVYKTTHIPSGRFYYGRHITDNPNDSYLGSGTYFKELFKSDKDKNHWSKDVQVLCETPEEMVRIESEFHKLYINNPLCINLMIGDPKYDGPVKHSEKTKKKMSKHVFSLQHKYNISAAKIGNPNLKLRGYKQSSEHINNVRLAKQQFYKIIFPNGQQEINTNLSKFSKDHNLSSAHMYDVLNGNRCHHKGFQVSRILND